MEQAEYAARAGHGSSRDAPCEGFGMKPTGLRYVLHALTPDHIRVETVEGIVGELMNLRGNKVFQVVTPAR